jgi:hypothetical protein
VTPVGSEIEYNFAVAEAIGAGASETTFSGRLIWELDAAGALAPRLVPAPTQLPEPDPPSIPDPEPVEPEAPPFVPPPIVEPPTAEAPPAKAPIMEWPVFEAVTGIPVEFPMNNGWLPQPDLWQLVKDYPAIDWGIAAIDVTESSFEFIADGEFILLRHSIAPIVTFDDAPQRNASFADALETSFLSKRLAMLAGNSHAADADGLIPEPSGLALAVFAFAAAGRCRPPRRAAPRFNSRQSFGINSPRSRRSQ